ncbi:glpG protein [Spirochaetia bacterium]|nr:glpG protein [Spirochaetia bacterium]GHV21113.1 glpG protein [Spirochaetia bacterium]
MNIFRKPFSYTYFNAVIILIIINAIVFAGGRLIPTLTTYLSMNPILVVKYGMVWQFFTYMFAHASYSHIIFNMLALFVFGNQLEHYIGSKEFLLYYLLTGFLAGVFSFVVFMLTGAFNVFLLGASGALFAVQLAYASFFPDSVLYIWGILPLRAPVMVLIFTAIELFSTIFQTGSGVAHLTHLAGFGFGWLYFIVRFGSNPLRLMLRKR